MPRIIDNYSLNEPIGEGVYGKVYKAIHIKTKQEYAVKVVPVQRFKDNPKLEQCTVNQINTLSSIESSPHIVKYIEMLKTNNNFYFVYEFCNGGTLEKLLKVEGHLNESKALIYFKQLVEAFKILYKNNIMHRDLKPDNVLFHNGVLKLGDFGFCKNLKTADNMASTMLGSPIYMAPEVLKGEIYTSKADIWSLGVVLFQMLFGYCPFESNSIAKLISALQENELKLPVDTIPISANTQNLLKRLLTKDHFKRIDWPGLFQLLNQESPVEQQQNNMLSPPVDDRLRVSLGNLPDWDFQRDRDFKKTLSVNTTKDPNLNNTVGSPLIHSSKVNSATMLQPMRSYEHKPTSFEGSPGKQPYYLNDNGNHKPASAQLKKTNTMVTGQPPIDYKRKGILEQHAFCVQGIKASIDFIRTEDKEALAYAHILLKKSEERLKKICESVDVTEIEYQDIIMSINNELRQIERELTILKEELQNNGYDMKAVSDSKRFLSMRFKDSDPNLRLWFDMTNFLFGERVPLKDMSLIQLSMNVKQRLM